MHGQAPGGRGAPSDGEVSERPGDAVYRRPPDHEVKAGSTSELCLKVTSSRPVGWWVINSSQRMLPLQLLSPLDLMF